jgi:hypothetical protein
MPTIDYSMRVDVDGQIKRVIGMSVAMTCPLNADFDGDELNIFAPRLIQPTPKAF